MIDPSRWTKHERGVVLAALYNYRALHARKATRAETLPKRRMAKADAYVAGDVIRQILET